MSLSGIFMVIVIVNVIVNVIIYLFIYYSAAVERCIWRVH